MRKILIAIGVLCSVCTMYAQEEKMEEQGLLIGAGAGFPVQNGAETDGFNSGSYWNYRHDYKLNSLIGYRLRFLPERTFFYDLDLTLGFQKMETDKYWSALHVPAPDKDKTLTEFVMPISVAASWNWRFARRFFLGAGVAPTLYAQPRAAFDLGLLAEHVEAFQRWSRQWPTRAPHGPNAFRLRAVLKRFDERETVLRVDDAHR